MPHPSSSLHGVRARILLYIVAFPGSVLLDLVSPLGVADWLVEVILVWTASVWGAKREMQVVAGISTFTMVLGLWSSPATVVPFWMGLLNRLVAILAIWTMVHVSASRQAAEQKQREAAAESNSCRACSRFAPPASRSGVRRGSGRESKRISRRIPGRF
jgi:hypothetical protein